MCMFKYADLMDVRKLYSPTVKDVFRRRRCCCLLRHFMGF